MITRSKKLEHNPNDISTYSNFDKILQKSLYIEVTLDFKTKTLYGEITSTYKYIDKTEKSSVLKTFTKEMFKLTSLKLRKGQKYKTRLHIKPKFNIIDNIKTLTSDKFIRKHRFNK